MKRTVALLLVLLLLVAGLFGTGAALWAAEQADAALQQASRQLAQQGQWLDQLEQTHAQQQEQLLAAQQQGSQLALQLAQAEGRLQRYSQLLEVGGEAGGQPAEHFAPYRDLLGESGQQVYDRLRLAFLQGEYAVQVPPREVMPFDTLFEVYTGLLFDDPGLFQLSKSLQVTYTDGPEGNTTQPGLLFEGAALEEARARFEAEATAVLAGAAGYAGELEKVKYIHDYLARTVEYDRQAPRGHEAYGAMVDKRAVCDGYAAAFKYYMNRLGIQAAIVTGHAGGEEHAWNLVLLEGTWYALDITWDDPVDAEAGTWNYDYFLLSDAAMGATHTRDARGMRLPACPSGRYQGMFRYPAA